MPGLRSWPVTLFNFDTRPTEAAGTSAVPDRSIMMRAHGLARGRLSLIPHRPEGAPGAVLGATRRGQLARAFSTVPGSAALPVVTPSSPARDQAGQPAPTRRCCGMPPAAIGHSAPSTESARTRPTCGPSAAGPGVRCGASPAAALWEGQCPGTRGRERKEGRESGAMRPRLGSGDPERIQRLRSRTHTWTCNPKPMANHTGSNSGDGHQHKHRRPK
jgi:hypothetical protein